THKTATTRRCGNLLRRLPPRFSIISIWSARSTVAASTNRRPEPKANAPAGASMLCRRLRGLDKFCDGLRDRTEVGGLLKVAHIGEFRRDHALIVAGQEYERHGGGAKRPCDIEPGSAAKVDIDDGRVEVCVDRSQSACGCRKRPDKRRAGVCQHALS